MLHTSFPYLIILKVVSDFLRSKKNPCSQNSNASLNSVEIQTHASSAWISQAAFHLNSILANVSKFSGKKNILIRWADPGLFFVYFNFFVDKII